MFFDTIDTAFAYWLRSPRAPDRIGAFFLFTLSDELLPTFIDQNGMADLLLWTANKCTFLVLHSPSREYIDSALQDTAEPWFDILREMGLAAFVDEPVMAMNGALSNTIRDLFTSCRNPYLRNAQISTALTRWGLSSTDHPCLIFFHDLAEGSGWHQGLQPTRGLKLNELRNHLQNYFSGNDFNKLRGQLQKKKQR